MMALPSPPPRRAARIEIAVDVVAGIGLVAGIALSAASLYALIQKHRQNQALRPPPPG
jgi:hypothetical protein